MGGSADGDGEVAVVAGAHALARAGVVVDRRQVVEKERARARTDSGGRTEGAVVSQVVYGSDDVCVVEIAMQVGAGMQAGGREAAGYCCWTAGLLDCWTARQIRGVWCLDETTKSELTGGMCGAAVLGHNAVGWSEGRMDWIGCTAR